MGGRTKKTDKSFEDSLKELEEVVAQLEKGELSLEESIKLFEQGIKLNQVCEEALKKADQKLDELKQLMAKEGAIA